MIFISRTDQWKPFDEELDHQQLEAFERAESDESEPVLPLPDVMPVVSSTPVKAA